MKRFSVLNVLLLALIALAAWRTVDVWRRDAPVVDAGSAARPLEPLPQPPRKPGIPQMVDTIAKQDLFDSSRKEGGEEDAEPQPEATPAPPPTLKLSGVLFVGLEPEAVLTDSAQGNKQIRLRVGEEISGYRVDRISAEEIALVSGNGEEVLIPLLIESGKGNKVARGPGGVPTPKAAAARSAGSRSSRKVASNAKGDEAKSEAERRREDARRRAERARERLKRLRAEAAKKR